MSSGLEKTIRDQLSSVSDLIKEQEETLANKLHDKNGECQDLAIRLAEKTLELEHAAADSQHASQVACEKTGEIEQLNARIHDLEEIVQERHQLEIDNKVLGEKLSNKATDNASLQKQLEDALGRNKSRASELQNLTRQIAERLEERGTDAGNVQSLRAKMTFKLELEKSKLEEAQRALQKHEEEKSKLAKELIEIVSEKAKFSKDLEELRTVRADEVVSLERTKQSLIHAEQRIVNLKDRLKKSEFKTRDVQHALTQWAAKKSNGVELPEGVLDLDLEAMRILVKSMANTQRESEAAKDCLRAVLELPATMILDDACRAEKVDCSPAGGQEPQNLEVYASAPRDLAGGTSEGAPSNIPPKSAGGNDTASMQGSAPLDTSKDSVRRIIVQSPFQERGSHLPPSVEEERMSRRRNAQPLSILKSPGAPAGDNGLLPPASPRSQQASTNKSSLISRPRSLPPTRRDSSAKPADEVADTVVDARTEGFLDRIKQSFGLQRTVSADNGRKRKGSAGEEGTPAKSPKTWQSMFGTLDFEFGDLTSSYFPVSGQSKGVTAERGEKPAPTMADPTTTGKGSLTNFSPRGILSGKQGQRGKARGVVRTYSKKPQE